MPIAKNYKAEFFYNGYEIEVRASFSRGKDETYLEPSEPAEFDLLSLHIDGVPATNLSTEEIAECLDTIDYHSFWIECCNQLYSQNEHRIKGY